MIYRSILLFTLFTSLVSRSQGFQKISADLSGINFKNTITETDMINGMTYEYLYNGGGVSIADFNQDGLEDIYFTSNQGQDKIYLNKGNLQFVDATKKFLGKCDNSGFKTGCTIVDINNDGYPDVYVGRAGPSSKGSERANLLYVNQGGKKFTEQASFYGIADTNNTTQSAFFDADLDGDLDLYLLNHPQWLKRIQNIRTDQPDFQKGGLDAYYENVNGKYENATEKAGFFDKESFGLGLVICDLNHDNFPDIYLTNDYMEEDKMYINQGDGTFKEVCKEKTQHIALYAMGVDAGDINNDLRTDIFSVDMASEDHVRSKKNMAGMSTKNFWYYVNTGHHFQYMFNALQLNLGQNRFAEIAQLSGLSKTDWSWAPLLADFDNDGYLDIFVTNGYKRDVRDNDFQIYYSKEVKGSGTQVNYEELLKKAPAVKVPNYIFKNNGDLTFSKKVMEWGVSEPINCNGAAYADLDNDGDLDLVVNAMDDASFIMENRIQENPNFIKVNLKGLPNNDMCIGAKIIVTTDHGSQIREVQLTRGFESSVSSSQMFGFKSGESPSQLRIIWNNKEETIIKNPEINSTQKIDYKTAIKSPVSPLIPESKPLFTQVKISGLDYKHEEINTDDFQKEILLPNKMSELGPFLSTADVNGDGLNDVFIGGSRGISGEIFIQQTDGTFKKSEQPALSKDKLFEDMGSVFFDADKDGDLDLYVVSGSNECPPGHQSLRDRLYINDGKGSFVASAGRIPDYFESGQKVLAHDLNKDGWMDLVVFGRQVPGNYPKTPRSYILLNKEGKFEDATKLLAPELEYIGMVTDALFDDADADGDEDLLVVGEWMPITLFENQNGNFKNVSEKYNLSETVGWWSSISLYQNGGKKKYLVGNIGANNKFHPNASKPLHIYMNDFDENGTNDIVLAKNQGSVCYPIRGRQCSSEQMPFIKEKFPSYDQFATADLEAIYTKEKLDASIHFAATIFESVEIEISGGKSNLSPMPNTCQMGPINAMFNGDFNQDGFPDVLLVGNKFEAEVETIRYDSNFGIVLLGTADGKYKPVLNYDSGLYLGMDIKSGVQLNINGVSHWVFLPKLGSPVTIKASN